VYKIYIWDFLYFEKLTELCRFVTNLWDDPRKTPNERITE